MSGPQVTHTHDLSGGTAPSWLTVARAASATYISTGASLAQVSSNTPRFDGTGGFNNGLIAEVARTRINGYSNQPDNSAGWYNSGGSSTNDGTTYLGYFSDSVVHASGGQSWHRREQFISRTTFDGELVSCEFWFIPGTSGEARCVFRDNSNNTETVVSGVPGSMVASQTGAGTVSNLEQVEINTSINAWRVRFTVTKTTTCTTLTLGFGPNTTTSGENVTFLGAQLQTSDVPTSWAPLLITTNNLFVPADVLTAGNGLTIPDGATLRLTRVDDTTEEATFSGGSASYTPTGRNIFKTVEILQEASTEITGSGAPSIAAATAAGAGAREVDGPGAGSAGAVAATGAGEREVAGGGAAPTLEITASGAGQREVSGSGSGLAGAVAASGVGDAAQVVEGPGAAVIAPVTGAGVGERNVTGAGAPELSPAVVAGSGEREIDGSGSATTPTVIVIGAAEGASNGFGAAETPVTTAAGAGVREAVGAGSPHTAPATASGLGAREITGDGAAVTSPVTASGSAGGSIEVTGSGAAVTTLVAASGSGPAPDDPEPPASQRAKLGGSGGKIRRRSGWSRRQEPTPVRAPERVVEAVAPRGWLTSTALTPVSPVAFERAPDHLGALEALLSDFDRQMAAQRAAAIAQAELERIAASVAQRARDEDDAEALLLLGDL